MEYEFLVGDRKIKIAEAFMSEELGTVIWDAAKVMLLYLSDEKNIWEGKRVIELGSGTGIVGIGAASLGAHVTVTDMKPMLDLIGENIKRNKLFDNCIVKEHNWGDDCTSLSPPYDVILLSDVITSSYADHMGALAKSVRNLSGENTRIILGFEKRHGNQDETLFSALGDDFVWKEVKDMSKYDPRYTNTQRIFIYEISLKSKTSK